MQIPNFWSVKIPTKIETGHCVQVPTRKVSKISPGRSLFYKVAGLPAVKTLVQVLSCEFWVLFRNTFSQNASG